MRWVTSPEMAVQTCPSRSILCLLRLEDDSVRNQLILFQLAGQQEALC
jgi:hypothetical protein